MSSRLFDHLNREHAAVGAFLEVLDQEAQALGNGDFASLSQLTDRKSQLVEQIALFGRQRETEQLDLGYGTDRRGADAAAQAGGEAIQTAWAGLLERVSRARDCNLRNGVMIHTHLDFTRKAIGFLQASGQPLYGPDGTHKNGTGSGNSRAFG